MAAHEWRQLSADPTPSTERVVVDESPRINALSAALQELSRKLDNLETSQAGHGHADLEAKIGNVQDALAETVASALREARCTQAKAHDELKAAFGELSNRLDALKSDHKEVTKDVGTHDDVITNHDEAINVLSSDIAALERDLKIVAAREPQLQLVEADVKPMPIWPLVLLIILWVADIALRFVPIK